MLEQFVCVAYLTLDQPEILLQSQKNTLNENFYLILFNLMEQYM